MCHRLVSVNEAPLWRSVDDDLLAYEASSEQERETQSSSRLCHTQDQDHNYLQHRDFGSRPHVLAVVRL